MKVLSVKFISFSKHLLCIFALLAVANCSRTAPISPPQNLPFADSPSAPVPPSQAGGGQVEIDRFIADEPLARMSEEDKLIAAKSQYNALQFGRPGAPRNWTGTTGTKGKIVVGPFIQKNGLICREFKHEVTSEQILTTLSATACRTDDGIWTVVA